MLLVPLTQNAFDPLLNKGQKWYGPKRQNILRRGGKNTQNCTKKIYMMQIITMVCSLT